MSEIQKNYITPAGFKALLDEHKTLKHRDRPEICRVIEWAAGNGDRSENGDYIYGKKKLREIDRRLRFLSKQIDSAKVVDPEARTPTKKILFGATVTIIDQNDDQKVYSIVGVDEIDIEKGRISWKSPIGAALLKASEGDIITFQSPKGEQEIEIVKVVYQRIDL